MKYKYTHIVFLILSSFVLLFMDTATAQTKDCTSFFTWQAVSGTNTTISFHNESTGNFNTWMWDFGDGTVSGSFHPEHEFASIGTYIVCLTISDGAACSDTYCDTIFVYPDCEADFEFTYVPTTPIHVQFTDLSVGLPNSWYWDFGDGITSIDQNPVHPYPVPGDYNVCLVIEHSDSIFTCSDSICKTVHIPDSVNCEADFIYDINPVQPLEVNFTDLSSGNITDWQWDFGDGNSSSTQNPVHVFSEPGEYLVCLNVYNADSIQSCFHFICKTLILNDSAVCQAHFIAEADSSSNVMHRFFFHDNTMGSPNQWQWDFGDGNLSHDQHTVHVYEEPGIYEVCLDVWNTNYPGYHDSHCILVKTSNYYQLGGLAFIGDNPINNPYPTGDTGIAVLYRQRNDQSLVAVDTTVFYNLGYYGFSNMMELPYIIHISLTKSSEHYNEFIPSYYPEAMRWQDAEAINLGEDMFEMNTILTEVPGANTGPGRINGRVVLGDKPRSEIHRAFHDIPITLSDESSALLEWTTTNEYGEFEFKNIALGTYILHADVPGVYSFPETVIVDESNPYNDTVRIELFYEAPLYVPETPHASINISSLYPNPVNDEINLELESEKDCQVQIEVLNLTGQQMLTLPEYLQRGSNKIEINAQFFPPGLYLLNLRWKGQDEIISKKFVKK